MISEGLKLVGSLTAELYKADGSVEVTHKHNAILTCGFDFICNSIGLASGRPTVMSHIAVGTSDTAVAVEQTALVTQIASKACAYAHTAKTKVFTMTTTFEPGEATGAIKEAAVQNAASSGILLDRVVFPVVNKGADDTLKMTFTFTLS